jgi:hypothetical protein
VKGSVRRGTVRIGAVGRPTEEGPIPIHDVTFPVDRVTFPIDDVTFPLDGVTTPSRGRCFTFETAMLSNNSEVFQMVHSTNKARPRFRRRWPGLS